MIEDCLFSYDNTPEDLKEIIMNNSGNFTICTSGVSCNVINGKYINITGLSEFNPVKQNKRFTLEEIINHLKPANLLEIALCIKIYNDTLFNEDSHIEEQNILQQIILSNNIYNKKYKVLSPLLMDSRGWLVWKYQLYHILSLAEYSSDKITKYIKGLNAKKPDIIAELQTLKIEGFFIYDAIKELTHPISNMTFGSPNLKDALILNNELKLF